MRLRHIILCALIVAALWSKWLGLAMIYAGAFLVRCC